MNIWIIEPREPLIFRDGRPFNAHPGASANSLPFPFPSTTTGAVRSKAGSDEQGNFTLSLAEALKIKVRGPLLVQLPADNPTSKELLWLAPAPADALLLKPGEKPHDEEQGAQNTGKATLVRLLPMDIKDARTDLKGLARDAELDAPLMLVGPAETSEETKREKPLAQSQIPSFWHWNQFNNWLLDPASKAVVRDWNELGFRGLQSEQRIHVTFDREQHAARDEALFETNGREFTTWDDQRSSLSAARQLALAVIVDEGAKDNNRDKLAGLATLGGERRIVTWRSTTAPLPTCPPELIEQVAKDGACRIILLTPAYFTHGCYPGPIALRQPHLEVNPKLRALVVDRPQVVSGWDLAYNNGRTWGRPKKTHRLVPAGSVLFLELDGTRAAIEQWVKATWLHCIGDDEQFRNEGFGLAVVGTWAGKQEEK